MGLCWIWLSGFALIGLSFYSTQRLPPLIHQATKTNKVNDNGVSVGPRITILSAPSPFSGSVGDRQSLAVRSWLSLSPQITVVLFAQHSCVFSFAQSLGSSRVLVEPDIDFTFLGTPFFHSMMAWSYSFKSEISVLVHPEAVLSADLIPALNYAFKLDHDWLLIASLHNTSHSHLHRNRTRNLHRNPCSGEKLVAWNNNADVPLHSAVLPPFLYGRGIHDDWVVNEAMSSGFRFVFDASSTISGFYPNDREEDEKRRWEYHGNSDLGAAYGSSFHRNFSYAGLTRLLKCDGRYSFVDFDSAEKRESMTSRSRWGWKKSGSCLDAVKPVNAALDCSLMGRVEASEEALEFPFDLESLLPMMADENRTVVLAVAGYSYKDMLMSWVCRLRRLKIANFVVSALDEETYRFSVLQGLPVFYDVSAPNNISFNDCHFGTKCFQRVTKVKSRLVLRILKLGYNVLLSDVDVYWFKNPLPFLSSYGPGVLVAQSDEYNRTGPINIPRRLNSGFYFARSDGSTMEAMEKVVKHAENSGMSEQPSFYDTLCGENGSKRVGDDKCLEPETNLTVQFLDRNLFPNGAYLELWNRKKEVRPACEKLGCFVLHNNWINGRQRKLERQVSSGLWEYDTATRMCLPRREKRKKLEKIPMRSLA